MKLLAATVLSLSIAAGAANGQQTIKGEKPMLTTEDIRAVAPALEKYAKDVVLGDLWKRAGLSARDRSIVTVAALIGRDQTVELPYYLNLALDNGVKPAELSEIITHLAFYTGWANAMDASPRRRTCSKAATSAPNSFHPYPVPSCPSTRRRRRSGPRASASSSARPRPAWSSTRRTCCSATSG